MNGNKQHNVRYYNDKFLYFFLKLCSFPSQEKKNFSSFSVKNLFRKLMFLWVIKAPVESALTTSNAMDR